MFLEHFILQTKEDFCTNTLFSSLEFQSLVTCIVLAWFLLRQRYVMQRQWHVVTRVIKVDRRCTVSGHK